MTTPALEAVGLGRDYPTVEGLLTVLDGISLELAPGGTLAIVGPSGSGKSTLLGLLAGLDRPSRGSVSIAGKDLATLDEAGMAALRGTSLGFVFQSHRLIDAFTAQENAALPLDLAGAADAQERAGAMLERVGLGRRLRHRPRQLSGGEQQRVAVARALAHRPALVLADEPTGSLDTATGHQIADLLFALAKEDGTALVLVTHDLALAARCERSLVLANGRIA